MRTYGKQVVNLLTYHTYYTTKKETPQLLSKLRREGLFQNEKLNKKCNGEYDEQEYHERVEAAM